MTNATNTAPATVTALGITLHFDAENATARAYGAERDGIRIRALRFVTGTIAGTWSLSVSKRNEEGNLFRVAGARGDTLEVVEAQVRAAVFGPR